MILLQWWVKCRCRAKEMVSLYPKFRCVVCCALTAARPKVKSSARYSLPGAFWPAVKLFVTVGEEPNVREHTKELFIFDGLGTMVARESQG